MPTTPIVWLEDVVSLGMFVFPYLQKVVFGYSEAVPHRPCFTYIDVHLRQDKLFMVYPVGHGLDSGFNISIGLGVIVIG